MTFAALVLKNLMRQRVRALLTLLGISIGITTVVALGAITAGLKETANAFIRSEGADFIVAQEGAADLSFSKLSEDVVGEVEGVDGVEAARPVVMHVAKAGSNPYFFLLGVPPADLRATGIELVEGTALTGAPDEIVLGEEAASSLGAAVGETVTVAKREFEVVGIFRSDVAWLSGGAYAGLKEVQEIAKTPDTVSLVYVTAADGTDSGELATRMEYDVEGVVTISNADEYSKVDQGFVMLDAADTAISVLAILIGAIGVMNTMIMSVFERTREIGVLRAVGWSGNRVLRMIMTESVALCIVAAAFGSLIGVGVSRLVTRIPSVGQFIVPAYPATVFVTATVIALVVGLVGAAYPAIRATRLTPMEALRYE